ncbi:MAG: hypothetical protein ISS11_01375, partial [Candidatus Marinimicrobia bacterium]|nr:hypothetical protein [Candidatus Neomarinimicrobiota bacterium]
SGFNALPGGYRDYDNGNYTSMGIYGFFWSSTVFDDNTAWNRTLHYYSSEVYRLYSRDKRSGFALRLLRD